MRSNFTKYCALVSGAIALIASAQAQVPALRPLGIGLEDVDDFGTTVEVSAGVKDGDQVILNPPIDLTDGHKIKVQSGPAAQMS